MLERRIVLIFSSSTSGQWRTYHTIQGATVAHVKAKIADFFNGSVWSGARPFAWDWA